MSEFHKYLLFVLVGIAVLGCSNESDRQSELSVPVNKLPVDVKVVQYSPFEQNETAAGSILPNRQIELTSELTRKITAVLFSEGSYVTKGQILYKLDDAEIKAKLRQAEAEVALAKLTESRLSKLLAKEAVRQEEYDIASTRLQSLQAAEDLLRIELEKTSIRAPFSGHIGITKFEVGALVNPGAPLVTLQDQSVAKIEFTVSERYLSNLRRGKPVRFSVGHEANTLTAIISAIEPGLDKQSRTITVQAVSPNNDGKLKAGMSARVVFSTAPEDAKALTLPVESLIPGAQGYNVFVVRKGVAKINPVIIGNRDESEVSITSGLSNGDTVMVSNILRSADGTPVQIVSAK